MYTFIIEGLSLVEPDLTCTFAGTSLGYRAVILCEQKQVIETARKEIKGNSLVWDEAFKLYAHSITLSEISLSCSWLEIKIFEDVKATPNDYMNYVNKLKIK